MSRGRAIAIERMQHMAEAVGAIESYVARGRSAFDADPMVRDAILYQIVILGEAAKAAIAADPSIEHELSEIEWSPWRECVIEWLINIGRRTEKSSGRPQPRRFPNSDVLSMQREDACNEVDRAA